MKRVRALILTAIALATAALSVSPIVSADGSEDFNSAKCDKAIIGSGRADWRREAVAAGPVGVLKPPLGQMSKIGGQLYTKMGILLEGETPVAITVPPALRNRVFLYYGRYLGRDGQPTTLFTAADGFAEIEFEPCEDRPRTIWPGGVRIKGMQAVHLTVTVAGRPPMILRLGRPELFVPPTR